MKSFVLGMIAAALCCVWLTGFAQSGASFTSASYAREYSNQSDCDKLCAAFKKVLAARANDFSDWHGKHSVLYEADYPAWDSTFTLPPDLTDYCRIEKSDGEYEYACTSRYFEAEVADQKFQTIAKSLKKALPEGCELYEGGGGLGGRKYGDPQVLHICPGSMLVPEFTSKLGRMAVMRVPQPAPSGFVLLFRISFTMIPSDREAVSFSKKFAKGDIKWFFSGRRFTLLEVNPMCGDRVCLSPFFAQPPEGALALSLFVFSRRPEAVEALFER